MFGDKLNLKEKVTNPYLIQRLTKPRDYSGLGLKDNPFSFGGGLKNGGLSDTAMDILRSIWSFDYMGSAEFEFGAVPAALHFIGEQAVKNNVAVGKMYLENDLNKEIYYICPKSYEAGVKEIINKLYSNEHQFRLKEICGLRECFGIDERSKRMAERYGGWLELDNGYLFFTKLEMFESTCKLFGITK